MSRVYCLQPDILKSVRFPYGFVDMRSNMNTVSFANFFIAFSTKYRMTESQMALKLKTNKKTKNVYLLVLEIYKFQMIVMHL